MIPHLQEPQSQIFSQQRKSKVSICLLDETNNGLSMGHQQQITIKKVPMSHTPRKRFSYNITPLSTSSYRNLFSTVHPPVAPSKPQPAPSTDLPQKIQQLESTNQRLIKEAASKFSALAGDIERVEAILAEKEEVIGCMRKAEETGRNGLEVTQEEIEVLKDALEQKEEVVKEYRVRAEQLEKAIEEERKPKPARQITQNETQTDSHYEESLKSQIEAALARQSQLRAQCTSAGGQLSSALTQLSTLRSDFAAFCSHPS